jgi:antigen flippase
MTKKHTYGQILKSSAVIGGSSVVNIAIGIVRTKAMAMLLGPSGVGLMGLFGSIIDLTISIGGMGIHSSGVRQIAEAAGSGDTDNVARTAAVLRRISIFLGVLGAVFLIGFSGPVSTLTFGGDQHATAVALLSIAVFFNVVSTGQGALIQGMRRISDLAKMRILGTFLGTLISIPVVYFLHEEGVVISIILAAAMGFIISWWYSRKIQIQTPAISVTQISQEAASLLKLGFAFMVTGLMMAGAAYVVRLIVVRNVGFEAAGLYQAAWGLGGFYIGFILQAMGSDFYPRLTAIINDNAECNRVVNEQAHVSMLLAGPGVIATLAFAPLVISLFYTNKFEGAVETLRWLCLGMTMRVVSWPLGYIIVAKKNLQNLFIFSDLAWTVVYLGLAWAGVNSFGLKGAGIAYFGAYAFHVLMNYVIVRMLTGFRWSSANIQTSALFLALIAVIFCSFYILPPLLAMGAGALAVVLSGIYSLQAILNLISPGQLPRQVLKALHLLRLTPAGHNVSDDLEPIPESAARDLAVANKSFLNIKGAIFAFMGCALLSMWMHWYGEVYGWPAGLGSVELEFETILSIFRIR